MSEDEELSQMDPESFSGRKLLPTNSQSIAKVPENRNVIVTLPPPSEKGVSIPVPSLLSNLFEFLDSELAQLLREGDEKVWEWVRTHFQISSFEALKLLIDYNEQSKASPPRSSEVIYQSSYRIF